MHTCKQPRHHTSPREGPARYYPLYVIYSRCQTATWLAQTHHMPPTSEDPDLTHNHPATWTAIMHLSRRSPVSDHQKHT